MKPPRAEKRATGDRRRQILNAALNCFLKQGVEATTIEQIRKASGASHGSIYHHFGSKEAIALAVYAETIHDYHAHVLEKLRQQSTAEAGIRAVVAAHLGWVAANADRSLYLTRAEISDASGTTAGGIAEILQTFYRMIYEWLQPFIQRGEIVRVPPALYGSLIFGPAAHFARHWLAHRVPLDMAEVADVLAAATWKSLKPAKGTRAAT
ncbi:MAG TPA: TetR/AcrR family transcriptional regulator [Pirellulales bacterium]|jgi:AcrR family transcriptional regulator|nr:TetR/AcrR family transcriptional regulator [Pirellulales bacterium]